MFLGVSLADWVGLAVLIGVVFVWALILPSEPDNILKKIGICFYFSFYFYFGFLYMWIPSISSSLW